MTLTGTHDEYSCGGGIRGPAFLIYYAPAFLRSIASTDMSWGLHVLAEIYEKSRCLWPSTRNSASETVIIRIDAIKHYTPAMVGDEFDPAYGWFVCKLNQLEGIVERHMLADPAIYDSTRYCALMLFPGGLHEVPDPSPPFKAVPESPRLEFSEVPSPSAEPFTAASMVQDAANTFRASILQAANTFRGTSTTSEKPMQANKTVPGILEA